MFASGKYAIAHCQRCDRRVPYRDLRPQVVNQVVTGLMVCDWCLDDDHPQLQVGRIVRTDPQALEHPRPDMGITESRGFFGWGPVLGQELTISIGTVQVV